VAFHASSVTCTVDGLAHLVSDDAAVAGIAAGRGVYAALCGHLVHAAAMVSSLGRPCPRCAASFTVTARHAELSVRSATGEPRRRIRSGRKRLRRLLGRHPDPASTQAPSGLRRR
jgi:hypothetical protein